MARPTVVVAGGGKDGSPVVKMSKKAKMIEKEDQLLGRAPMKSGWSGNIDFVAVAGTAKTRIVVVVVMYVVQSAVDDSQYRVCWKATLLLR